MSVQRSPAFERLIQDGQQLAIENSIPLSGITSDSDAYSWFTDVPSASGPLVNERTAMCVSAVYRCVSLIAGGIASLPLHTYQKTEQGRDRVDHALRSLLNDRPSPTWNAASFWEYIISSQLLRGDGLAEIVRGRRFEPIAFRPLNRNNVRIETIEDRLHYYIYPDDGRIYGLDQDDVLHFPSFGFDGKSGLSVIRKAAKQSIGVAIAANQYSGEFFTNGARPDFFLTADNLSPENKAEIRKAWAEAHQGIGKRYKPGILTGGLRAEKFSLSAEDSQLLETRKFQVSDICMAFGVPPHLVGFTEKATTWGSGLEEMTRAYVKYTLLPYLSRMEQELNYKLFKNTEQFFEFNVDGFMEGDSGAQAEYFGRALGGPGQQGWMTLNEVRKLKNLPPEPNGDHVIIAGNPEQNHEP